MVIKMYKNCVRVKHKILEKGSGLLSLPFLSKYDIKGSNVIRTCQLTIRDGNIVHFIKSN